MTTCETSNTPGVARSAARAQPQPPALFCLFNIVHARDEVGEYKSGDEMCERKKKIYARRVARWHTPTTCATIEFALRGSCVLW